MKAKLPQFIERCIAVDLHKHYVVVGGVDREQNVILAPRRMDFAEWERWSQKNLRASDAVVVESTTNAWHIYDRIVPLVGYAVVANPIAIGKKKVKTDKKDVLHLAELLAGNMLPIVWVPPEEVRELRALIAHRRRRLLKRRTMLRNGLHSVLHRHNVKLPPKGSLFGAENRKWWNKLEISVVEKLSVAHDLSTLDHLGPQIVQVDAELKRMTTTEPWMEMSTWLLQLTGFGLITTMTVLAAIGDVSRFEDAKKLVGYAGLGSSVHDSGQKRRTGSITKGGRTDLRWALVEVVQSAVRYHPYWKAEYERLSKRMSKQKAKVAIARKLLVAVWHVLSEQTADRHSSAQRIAYKFYTWSYNLSAEHFEQMGLTRRQYVRYQLMRLGIGADLRHVNWTQGIRRSLASVEEVRALRPEMAPKH